MNEYNVLFVYGTLLEGEYNHGRLADSKKVADQVWVYGELFDTHCGYPALYTGNDDKVSGELYEVSPAVMKQIDELEGYFGPFDSGNLYDKVEVEVHVGQHTYKALTYVYAQPKTKKLQKIDSGDWRMYAREGF